MYEKPIRQPVWKCCQNQSHWIKQMFAKLLLAIGLLFLVLQIKIQFFFFLTQNVLCYVYYCK